MSTKAKYTGGSMNFFDTRYNNNLPSKMWADCPWLAAMADPSIAHFYREDFAHVYGPGTTDATMAGYTRTQAASEGTVAIATNVVGGVMTIAAGSADAHKGANIQKTHPIIKPAAGKDIWYETRIHVTAAEAKIQFFAGLSKLDTTLLPNGVITAEEDLVGLYVPTSKNGLAALAGMKGAARGYTADVFQLPATAFTVGFRFKGITTAELWINGSHLATVATANVPVVDLTPSWVCQGDGTGTPTMNVDYWAYLQLR